MQEGVDLKLTALLYRKKIWISLLCALVGAVFAGGLYFIVHVIYAPAREYEAVSKLYLTFAADDDGDAYQYYNGYTWNDLMGTEPILDKIMEILGTAYEREDVKASVSADILSDIRLLTITVDRKEATQTDEVIRATEEALIRFGEEMIEFDKIEVIEHGQAALVVVEDETLRAVIAGAVIGFLLSLLGRALFCLLDDSIYVPSDIEKRYKFPVLGVRFVGDEKAGVEELERHIEAASKGSEKVVHQDVDEAPSKLEPAADDSGMILYIPYGRGNGKLLERWVREAEFWGYHILGAVITEADKGLYHLYFRTFDISKRKK